MPTLPDAGTRTHARTHTLLMINYETCFQQQQGYNLEVKGTLPPGKDLKTDTHTCRRTRLRARNGRSESQEEQLVIITVIESR